MSADQEVSKRDKKIAELLDEVTEGLAELDADRVTRAFSECPEEYMAELRGLAVTAVVLSPETVEWLDRHGLRDYWDPTK